MLAITRNCTAEIMCGFALVCVGLWMHICHDRLFYGVLLLDNPTLPFVVLHRLAMAVFGVGCILATMCFVGGCGAATECICFLVSMTRSSADLIKAHENKAPFAITDACCFGSCFGVPEVSLGVVQGVYITGGPVTQHALLSTLCIIAQIVVAVLSSVFQQTVYTNISTSMQYQVRHQYNETGAQSLNTSSVTYRVTVAWDELQKQLECCGGLGPADYHYSAWFNHTPESDGSFVPMSCCGVTTHDYYCQFEAIAIIQHENKPSDIIHSQGCFDAILDWYATYRPLVAFVVIVIDILLLLDIISSLVLVRIIQRKQADYGWRPNYY